MTANTLSAARPVMNGSALRAWIASPLFLKLAAGAFLLLAWEVTVRAFAPAYVAKPIAIAQVFTTVISDPQFLAAARATLGAVMGGLLISLVFGTVVGFAMGRIDLVERGMRYYVNSLFATPMVAILPLITLWFGYNADARLAVVVFAAFFSIAVNACDGARSVPPDTSRWRARSAPPPATLCSTSFSRRRCLISSPASASPPGARWSAPSWPSSLSPFPVSVTTSSTTRARSSTVKRSSP